MASDHGAWTRPPNGVSKRQPPVAELVAEPLDDDPLVGRQGAGRVALVLEVGEQVLGRPLVEVVVLAQALRGVRAGPWRRAPGRASISPTNAPSARPELDRPADGVALPERQLARDAGRRADGDPVVADVLHPPDCWRRGR